MRPEMILGIDAINLRRGGGTTHLQEVLSVINPLQYGFKKVVLWGGSDLLRAIPKRTWLEKHVVITPQTSAWGRLLWHTKLPSIAKQRGCHLLFVPGGSLFLSTLPFVTMSRNLLPFDQQERARYLGTATGLKLSLLRITQKHTFRRARGLIFLTQHAQGVVEKSTGRLANKRIVPHGVNRRFFIPPRAQRKVSSCSPSDPFRLLYVSTIDLYKHADRVVEEVASLRRNTFWPLELNLVGPAFPRALNKLMAALALHDPTGDWAKYRGNIPFPELHLAYRTADVGIFASTCENMPNTLLEKMAAGLPIVCSSKAPMPAILRRAGVYFDPERRGDLSRNLFGLIEDERHRIRLARSAYGQAGNFSWQACAKRTFEFLAQTMETVSP